MTTLPKGWAEVELGEVCKIVSGATPKTGVESYWGGPISWTTPKDLSDLAGEKYLSETPRTLSESGLKSCGASILPPGSVLMSSRAPIGLLAINAIPVATNQGFKSFIPSDRVDPSYLYRWLKAHRPHLEALGRGATFKEISKSIVARIRLPLPPLDEQRRIAAILDKADELRAKRRAALSQLDALTQAIFIDMFGDPVTNPNGLPLVRICDLGTVVTGNTPPRSNVMLYGPGIEWIKSDNIDRTKPFLSRSAEQVSAAGKVVARVVPPGSVLVTCIAGSPSSIGNAALADREVAFNQQINAIVPTECDSVFLLELLRGVKRLVQSASTGGMKGLVSKSRLSAIEVPVPSQSDQEDFTRLVRSVWRLKKAHDFGDQSLDELFVSLQSRAFRGEL